MVVVMVVMRLNGLGGPNRVAWPAHTPAPCWQAQRWAWVRACPAAAHVHTPAPHAPPRTQHPEATVVTEAMVEAVLGPPLHSPAAEVAERVVAPGAACGLVWTAAGGKVQFIEAVATGLGQPGRCVRGWGGGRGRGVCVVREAQGAWAWVRAWVCACPPCARVRENVRRRVASP